MDCAFAELSSVPVQLYNIFFTLSYKGLNYRRTVLKRKNEMRSFNHCCSKKTIIVIYPDCVVVALVIQHGKLMYHFVFCGLSGCKIFVNIVSQIAKFSEKMYHT